MSRATLDAPMMRPLASVIGDTVNDTGMSRPSFVCRTVSKWSIFWPRRRRDEHVFFLRPSIVGNDQEDLLADRLGRRVAEELLRGPVPRGDNPVQRLADDGIVG